MKLTHLFLFTGAFMAGSAVADQHNADRALKFTMTYEGTPSTGEFTDFSARASFDPDQLDNACLDVKVNTASADMGSEDLNAELPGPAWFASEEYPRAHFYSDDIRSYPESEDFDYVAEGKLQLKGTSKTILLPFNWTVKDNTGVLGGQTEVSRLDFGIGSGEWADTSVIGEMVTLEYRTRFRWEEGHEGAPCPVQPSDAESEADQDSDVISAAEPDQADLPDPTPESE